MFSFAVVNPSNSRVELSRNSVSTVVVSSHLSRLDSVVINAKVPLDLAKNVPSYACTVADAARFDAYTDWLALQQAESTISRVGKLLNQNAR